MRAAVLPAELSAGKLKAVYRRLNLLLVRCPAPNMSDWVMELPDIRRAIRQLAQDSNSDVRHFVSFLPPILGADTSQEEKVFRYIYIR